MRPVLFVFTVCKELCLVHLTSQFSVTKYEVGAETPSPLGTPSTTHKKTQKPPAEGACTCSLREFLWMSTSSSDSPVFQIYLVLICLALLLLKKEHICLLSPSYTICHKAELLSPFFWQVQRPQVCSNSRITGRETASAAPGISGCDLEALHGSTPGPAQQVSTWPEWGSSQDPKDRKLSAGKRSPSPGASRLLTSHWRLSLSSSFQ